MAAAALPALAGAGGGGGLKMPEQIHITPTTKAQGCFTGWNCCSDGNQTTVTNVRIVYTQTPGKEGEFAEGKTPSKVASFFKKFLCCCCGNEKQEENLDVVKQFEALLEDRYGPVATKFAPVRAQIDLQEKKADKAPIYKEEFESIQKNAVGIFKHLETLELMMEQLQFFHGRKDGHEGKIKIAIDKRHKTNYKRRNNKTDFSISVRDRDGNNQEYSQAQMIADICTMPLHKKGAGLPNQQNRKSLAQNIASVIEETLIENNLKEISSDQIKELFCGAVEELGLEMEEPEFLKSITDTKMRQAIAQKRSLEELTKEEFEMMYQLAKKLDRRTLKRGKTQSITRENLNCKKAKQKEIID